MNRFSLTLTIALTCMPPASQTKPADSADLDAVLKKMDAAAASFRSTQADFEWDTYEKVIDEIDEIQTGTIYFRRTGKDIEMMADVKMAGSDLTKLKPEPKYVLYSNGKVSMYQPKPDQVTVYDLVKAFDVTYLGPETINGVVTAHGVATAKLQLIPKSDKVRNTYNRILLWIDLDKGISVQQQFFSPQGDFRLTKYSSINEKKIPDDVFKLKTTGKTQTISPKG